MSDFMGRDPMPHQPEPADRWQPASGGRSGPRAGCWRRFGAALIDGLLLGYLWMLWDPEKQTWHDKLATTVVVPADAYRAA